MQLVAAVAVMLLPAAVRRNKYII
ncbi:hypothetical protein SBDP1_650001 [Syntrophobacter sp. SbD1]|nr:hypothetical protein SBDP1_650001 [Syntrophobacter sp. SbD1]